jgi:hypothetical protein
MSLLPSVKPYEYRLSAVLKLLQAPLRPTKPPPLPAELAKQVGPARLRSTTSAARGELGLGGSPSKVPSAADPLTLSVLHTSS